MTALSLRFLLFWYLIYSAFPTQSQWLNFCLRVFAHVIISKVLNLLSQDGMKLHCESQHVWARFP